MIRTDDKIWEDFLGESSEETFTPVYERTRNLVYTICYRVLGSEEEASDGLQGTYERLLVWIRDCREKAREVGMIWTLRRLAWLESDRMKKKRNRRSRKEFTVENMAPFETKSGDIRELVQKREIRQRLEVLVSTLQDRYRIPIMLHYFQGMSHREIADMMGRPVDTIYSRIRRGLKKLAPLTRRAGLGEPTVIFGALLGTAGLLTAPESVAAASLFASASKAASTASAGASAEITAVMSGGTTSVGVKIAAVTALVAAGAALLFVIPSIRSSLFLNKDAGPGRTGVPFSRHEKLPSDPSMDSDRATDRARGSDESPGKGASSVLVKGGEKQAPSGSFTWFGRIVSSDKEKPIPDARVSLLKLDPFLRPFLSEEKETSVLTDEEGMYRMYADPRTGTNVFRGQVIHVDAEGYECRFALFPDRLVENRAEYRIDFSLDKGGRISGHVVDSSDQPICGATVGFPFIGKPDSLEEEKVTQFPAYMTRTDGEGAFSLDGVPVGGKLRIPVRAGAYLPLLSEEIREGTTGVRLVLEPARSRISGGVVEYDDKPVPGAFVFTISQDQRRNDLLETLTYGAAGMTDEKGIFDFPEVIYGRQIVRAVAPFSAHEGGYQEAKSTVSLPEGETVNLILRLEGVVTVKGRFVDHETGSGISGVRVAPPDERNIWGDRSGVDEGVLSGKDGYFSMKIRIQPDQSAVFLYSPPSGWFTVNRIRNDLGGMHICRNCSPTSPHEVEIRLTKGRILQGRVVHSDETTPAVGVMVSIRDKGRQISLSNTEKDGRFSLNVFTGGDLELIAQTSSSYVEKIITVSEELLQKEILLVLQDYSKVTGHILNGKGEPVSGISLRWKVESDGDESNTRGGGANSGLDGSYTLKNVMPGQIQIQARIPADMGYISPDPLTVHIDPGENVEGVDIVLVEGDILQGVVTSEKKNPIPGAMVMAYLKYKGEYISRSAVTDEEGHYELGGLPLGECVNYMQASHSDYDPESRENINPYDGPQNFTLRPMAKIVLEAVDAGSGKPVTSYAYRLLRESWNGWSTDKVGNHQNVMVENTEGRVDLGRITMGKYRVDVVERDQNEGYLERRGTAFFTIESGQEKEKIEVRVGPGETITGKVVKGEEGPPVEGVSVDFEMYRHPMSVRRIQKSPVFDPKGTVTDTDGNFEIANVSPGNYTLIVEKGELKPDKPVEVEVREGQKPPPLTIVLGEGCVVWGQVIDEEGNPMPRLDVYHKDYREWFGDEKVTVLTDDEGMYRFSGLQVGRHWIGHENPENRLPYKNTFVNVEAGEEKRQDFDYSEIVRLEGQAIVNGRDWTRQVILTLLPVDGGKMTFLELQNPGYYKARVIPGKYDLCVGTKGPGAFQRFFLEDIRGGISRSISVPSETKEQIVDLDVKLTDMELVVETPQGEAFRKGIVEISQRFGGRVRNRVFWESQHSQTSKMSSVPPGEYKALYRSEDGLWNGESDWTPVVPGGDNILAILLEDSKPVRVGGWTPEQMSESFIVLDYNLSGVLKEAGDYEAILEYEKGYHGLAIDWVSISEGGKVLYQDTHIGWTGITDLGNIYRLRLDPFHPGAPYKLSVMVRCDGGTDSTGSVYLLKKR